MRVRAAASAAILAALLAAAPVAAARAPRPEEVVRAWSKALNANDNEGAARLFAPNAQVLQGGLALRLQNHRIAVAFNASLPCSGTIVAIRKAGTQVLATFVLGERPKHQCDAPGGKASAVFDVRAGKIVLWAQVANPPEPRPKPKPSAQRRVA
jgi:limonene-1,2-epoxide hydrolase